MNQSDVYYRALAAYRARVSTRKECARDLSAAVEADGTEALRSFRTLCTVDEEWIKKIEEGLVHIEKAIKEDRQFIYSNGEVIPIEKVKNVSKDSVQHLARHSDLITRVTEGEDLIPDKLYTVERDSDYAVYENRFLYMLLCYLRDFVTLRYQKILDLTNCYNGSLSVHKEISVFNRQLQIDIDIKDQKKDDLYLREHNPAKPLIDRINLILKAILSFLATPLMDSVSKVAMLKPPITKTNVLKMDTNFKGAVALYEYIISYKGPGFTTEEQVREISPFRGKLAEDLGETEMLMAFLIYQYGLDISGELADSLEFDEAQARQAELRKKTEQMESIRRRLQNGGEPPEAYILKLEKHVRALQNEADRLEPLYVELDALKTTERELMVSVERLTAQNEQLQETLIRKEEEHAEAMRQAEQEHLREKVAMEARHKEEMETAEAEHLAAITSMRESHTAEVQALNEKHFNEVSTLNKQHLEEVTSLNEQHSLELTELNDEHDREVSSLKTLHESTVETMKAEHRETVTDLSQRLSDTTAALETTNAENSELAIKNGALSARIIAVRNEHGDISSEEVESMTEMENFDELEQELEAFVKFYKQQWALTKRKIRKDLINMKNIKGQAGKK